MSPTRCAVSIDSAPPSAVLRAPPKVGLAIACVLATAMPAAAHPLDLGYLRLDAPGERVAIALDLDVAAAARLLGADTLDAGSVRARAAELAGATLERAPIETERGSCAWSDTSASLDGRTARISGTALCPAGSRTLRWELPFVAEARVSAAFQLLVKAGELVTTLDRTHATLALGASPPSIGFTDFVWSGIEHIGAAPAEWHDAGGWKLPDGIDHILFLLALMLAGGTLLQLVGIASGFTLGHSITLALSTLGVVRPPASLIEPLIALSIALAAAQAMLGRAGHRRWQVAACFGLVHGFGFASALVELDLPARDAAAALFGYNAGVELGQLAILVLAAPLVLALHRSRLGRRAIPAIASIVFVAGAYWFVQRLIG